MNRSSSGSVTRLESQQVGVTEVLLSPRTALAGKTLGELRFHDRYGLNVLAVWREGKPRRSGLRVTGAALMVLFRCLSMDEASRAIDWRVVFLIAA